MACVTCHQKKVKCVFQGSNDCCDRCLSNRLCCEPHKSQQGRRTDLAEESLAKRVHISSPSGCSEPIESDFSNDVEVLDVFYLFTQTNCIIVANHRRHHWSSPPAARCKPPPPSLVVTPCRCRRLLLLASEIMKRTHKLFL